MINNKQNNSKCWQWLLISIVGLLVLLCVLLGIPYLLNYFIQQPQQFAIVGNGKDWLMFWATWLSATASFAMVFFTWRTLKKQQQNFNCQIEMQRLHDITNKVADFYNSIDLSVLDAIADHCSTYNQNNDSNIKQIISDYIRYRNSSSFGIDLFFSNNIDSQISMVLNGIDKYITIHNSLFSDLQWLLLQKQKYSKNGIDFKIESSEVKCYKDNYEDRNDSSTKNRIWTILESNDYKINSNEIVDLLMNNRNDILKARLQLMCQDLIKHEQNRINKKYEIKHCI